MKRSSYTNATKLEGDRNFIPTPASKLVTARGITGLEGAMTSQNTLSTSVNVRASAQEGQGGPGSPIDMLGPLINKLTLLKTVALVLISKLWPPLINAWPP